MDSLDITLEVWAVAIGVADFAVDSEGVGVISKPDERLVEARDVTFRVLETII